MPQAVMHVLIAIILLDLYRDYVLKGRHKLPLSLVLLGGIAGLLPDIDVPAYWLVHDVFGFQVPFFHRLITHSILFPLFFLLVAVVFYLWHREDPIHVGKRWATVFAIISVGITIHIALDMMLSGYVMPFYPFMQDVVSVGILSKVHLPGFWAGLDAIILLAWLYHEERKHKIRDFI